MASASGALPVEALCCDIKWWKSRMVSSCMQKRENTSGGVL
jgi:hypothetical protein